MDNRGRDWRTILLLLAGLGGALLAFALAALMLACTALGFAGGDFAQNGTNTLQAIVLASGITFVGTLFLPAAYYSMRRLRGQAVATASLKPLRIWQAVLLVLFWIGVSLLAQLFVGQNIPKWFTPPLYLLAIGTPVYFMARLAAGGLNAGSRQGWWGVFATSMALGPTLSILAEGALAILGLLVVGICFGMHPEQLSALKHLANQLTGGSGMEQALNALGPWLDNPVAFLLALLFFSGFTPVIEETAKSIATWTIFDHLQSPAQGFVVGALSGAGFGLLESLLASATPDANWASTLMIRGGSTMMHIMTTSLTGWGIASFRSTRRAAPMLGIYILAMFLHGLWNASVVMLAFGGLRMDLTANTHDAISVTLMAVGASVLTILCLAIPLALGSINWKLRAESLPPSPGISKQNLDEGSGGSGQGAEEVQ